MPAAELVVWLIPGYIALLLYLHAYPLRTRQSYEWFFQAAAFGIVCFLVSRVALGAGALVLNLLPCVGGYCPSSDVARTWWASHVRFAYSFSLLIGLLLAPTAAWIVVRLRPPWELLKAWIVRIARESPTGDIFYFACRRLDRKLVIVSVDGGKVYVGFLVDYTSDPDEPEKYIKIVPIMSGRREVDKPYVEFTTPYLTSTQTPSEEELKRFSDTRAILIPVKKIVTFAPFDRELHEWFVEKGMVTITFKLDEPEAGSEENEMKRG